ncbi:MAG: hypothetical protein UT39_C0012G0004 [Candidatus Woesebacteria bacterium GW2011_GWA1_39_21]|uniref:DUF5666 domain-containing protein n=1 Tax=Candidatus Woesebacteria bacterium GW2011_GWA1_39_21 TaxID=1618550 RepID=A0A0G0RB86_9BACT|nr:MAG: hypothetical protein UT39_C0012G0004 [Candidatus Woesebacteria bacterium GW2011_GWA1_39_21]
MIPAVLVLVVGGGVFYAGMKYQQHRVGNQFRQFAGTRVGVNQNGVRNGVNNQNFGNRPISGQILSVDDKAITLKLNDGSTKIVILSDSTAINQSTQAQKSDLVEGGQVTVIGTINSDGSVTAQDVQIGSLFRGIQTVPTSGQN